MKKDLISNQAQLDDSGKLIHLLGLEDLPKSYLIDVLDKADNLIDSQGHLKKSKMLDDMSVVLVPLRAYPLHHDLHAGGSDCILVVFSLNG